MSGREIYTYENLADLKDSRMFEKIRRFPQITVSADLRKSLKGTYAADRMEGLFSQNSEVCAADFGWLASKIDPDWGSSQSRFHGMILLSELIRKKMEQEDERQKNWLTGILRNMDSLYRAAMLLEQSGAVPEDLPEKKDRNLQLFSEAWEMLRKKDPSFLQFRRRMEELKNRAAWMPVLCETFEKTEFQGIHTLVFHGFYNITSYQERIMCLLEQAGFQLIFLIPYDARYPFVYEIWKETYSEKHGYPPQQEWHMEIAREENPWAEVFEGRQGPLPNQVELWEYASVMEFVNAVKKASDEGYTVYSPDTKTVDSILKEYYPEAYGDRKLLSYPIGQFLYTLSQMWEDDVQEVALSPDDLMKCVSSGWLSADGESGREYLKDLKKVLPFFKGCRTRAEWKARIGEMRRIQKEVLPVFDREKDLDASISRWQKSLENPLSMFGCFSLTEERLEMVLVLMEEVLSMADELFEGGETILAGEYLQRLDHILRTHPVSAELYEEERSIVEEIFEELGKPCSFHERCHPSDIRNAFRLFFNGSLEDGEIRREHPGMVSPLYSIDGAPVKQGGKVHVCLCSESALPGKKEAYTWPLSGALIRSCYEKSGNEFLENLLQVNEQKPLCGRYFLYSALKNRQVQLSWVSVMGEKDQAPSAYLKLLHEGANIPIQKPETFESQVRKAMRMATPAESRILPYDKEQMPHETPKEARMDYSLCPMRYVLGYVADEFPWYQTEFQQTYAVNGLVWAVEGLWKKQGQKVSGETEEICRQVLKLFPGMRKMEKRQISDFGSYEKKEDLDYSGKTRCGERYYTDERLKVYFPEPKSRKAAEDAFLKLCTPDGRQGMDLSRGPKKAEICRYCPQAESCLLVCYDKQEQEDFHD